MAKEMCETLQADLIAADFRYHVSVHTTRERKNSDMTRNTAKT